MTWYPKEIDISPTTKLTETELARIDGITEGTVAVSKAIVPTTGKHIDTIAIADGGLCLGAAGGTAVTSNAAELNLLDTAAAGVVKAGIAVIAGASKNVDELGLPVGGLKIGAAGAEVAITPSAAELNALASSGITNADLIKLHAVTAAASALNNAQSFFDHVVTAAEVKACNHVVVPAIAGKQFFPTFAAMVATGDVTTSTVITLKESTSGGVVLSHVAADMTSGTWAGPTGGAAVTTRLNTALTVGEGIIIADTAANSLTVTTAIRVIVAGYYV